MLLTMFLLAGNIALYLCGMHLIIDRFPRIQQILDYKDIEFTKGLKAKLVLTWPWLVVQDVFRDRTGE